MWLLATGNAHKVVEIGEVLAPLGVELLRPRDVGVDLDPEEWGETFAANAVIKALAFAEETGRVCLADDSGLEVEALGWAPGVYSARYAGSPCDDAANNAKLMRALAETPDDQRGARYRCVIAGAWPAQTSPAAPDAEIATFGANATGRIGDWFVATWDGSCEGAIGHGPRGEGGFGYDPYFVLPDGRHMAELPNAEKHAISHRGVALAKMVAWLEAHPTLKP